MPRSPGQGPEVPERTRQVQAPQQEEGPWRHGEAGGSGTEGFVLCCTCSLPSGASLCVWRPGLKVPGPSRALPSPSVRRSCCVLTPSSSYPGSRSDPSGLQAGLRPLHLAGRPLLQRSLPVTPASGLPLAPQHLLHPSSSSPAPLGLSSRCTRHTPALPGHSTGTYALAQRLIRLTNMYRVPTTCQKQSDAGPGG